MMLRVRRVMVPLRFNDDATSLAGRFSFLTTRRVTGKVVSSGQETVVSSIPTATTDQHGNTFLGQRIKSDTYKSIRLEDREGHIREVNLKNNNIFANPGDLITVAQAKRRTSKLF